MMRCANESLWGIVGIWDICPLAHGPLPNSKTHMAHSYMCMAALVVLKFSPTWLVGRELEWFIRGAVLVLVCE